MVPKTNEKFQQEVYNLVGDEYTFLENYKYAKTNIKVRHNKCGNVYEVTPNNFLRGKRCAKCHHKKLQDERKMPYQVLRKNLYEKHNGKIVSLSSNYNNNRDKMMFQCLDCNFCWKAQIASVLHNTGCPNCSNQIKKNIYYYKNIIYEKCGNEYTLLSNEYINNRVGMKFIHNKCHTIFTSSISSFMGSRYGNCPHCSTVSNGENDILKILRNKSIDYIQQYHINSCRYVRPLPFDFAVFNDYGKLIGLIEYDGIQHFKPIDYFGGESAYKEQQIKDNIKNDYCKNNNIKLLRVPYTINKYDELQEEILKFLTEIGV